MTMIALKCPSCGANLELDDDREIAYCQYCGTRLMLDLCQRVKLDGPINVEGIANISNLIARAEQYESQNDIDKALEYYNRILDIDVSNAEATEGVSRLNRVITEPNVTVECQNNPRNQNGTTNLFVDGELIQTLNAGQTITITVGVGDHEIGFGAFKGKNPVVVSIKDRNTRKTVSVICNTFSSKAYLK